MARSLRLDTIGLYLARGEARGPRDRRRKERAKGPAAPRYAPSYTHFQPQPNSNNGHLEVVREILVRGGRRGGRCGLRTTAA